MPSLQAIDSTQPPSIDMQVKEREIEGEREKREAREKTIYYVAESYHYTVAYLTHMSTFEARYLQNLWKYKQYSYINIVCAIAVCCATASSGKSLVLCFIQKLTCEGKIPCVRLHCCCTDFLHAIQNFFLLRCLKTVCCCNAAHSLLHIYIHTPFHSCLHLPSFC